VTQRDPAICVVHLARAVNGTEPLRSFLDSYRAHPAGVKHDLLVVFKGFRGPLPADYELILRDVPHQRRFIGDSGYDIDAYFEVARQVDYDVLCFLNSFSAIVAGDWLAKLHRALTLDGVGMVGATGSWQSKSSDWVDPAAIVVPVPKRRAWKRALIRVFPFLAGSRYRLARWWLRRSYPEFPNPHLRTNAFMLRRATALGLAVERTRRKADAYRLESGKHGLTRQVLGMSQRVLVVDCDGRTYEMPDWHASNTFWRLDQGNLLVADNQTRAYDVASNDDRLHYSTLAWGPHANPGAQA
jgi:hypothetical protein